MQSPKDAVREYWDREACGEVYADGKSARERYLAHATARYELEPYIHAFAGFEDGCGKDVLEVGVGMGADHAEWAKHEPAQLAGVDLTSRAVDMTRERLASLGLTSNVHVADAEQLPFEDESFDIVYSWGVLHHSPDTAAAFREVRRVLRPGGEARIMIYHRPSLVGLMLWVQYGLLAGRPLRSLRSVYAEHLESPGTKGFTVREARALLAGFRSCTVRSRVGFGDLLEGEAGQRHPGAALRVARRLWPRPLVRHLHPLGLMLLIDATK